MPSIRQARVAEMIKRELAEIFQRELGDPRLGLMSVNEVEVAPDLSVAKVFVSAIGDDQKKAEALKALQGASGFLRGQLGHRIELRSVPALQFRYDTGVERGARMFELLREEEREIGAGDAAALPEGGSPEGGSPDGAEPRA